jgi:hypothetical protein
MPRVGFEPTIPVFERAKTVHALDRAATVIGYASPYTETLFPDILTQCWSFSARDHDLTCVKALWLSLLSYCVIYTAVRF